VVLTALELIQPLRLCATARLRTQSNCVGAVIVRLPTCVDSHWATSGRWRDLIVDLEVEGYRVPFASVTVTVSPTVSPLGAVSTHRSLSPFLLLLEIVRTGDVL